MSKRVLVTGAAGFIGFHLCQRLLMENYEVFGVDNMDTYYSLRLKESRLDSLRKQENFVFFRERFGDEEKVNEIFENVKPNIVIHLAAQAGVRYSIENPGVYLQSNVAETFNLLEAIKAHSCEHFLFASTSSAYGASDRSPLSETFPTLTPMSFYAATKISCEAIAHSYSNIHRIPTTALRFFTVYGPWGRPDMALIKFLRAIDKGEKLQLFNGGKMERDFTYVDDIIDAVCGLTEHIPQAGKHVGSNDSISPVAPFRTVNIGNGEPRKLTEFLSIIERYMGEKAKIEMQPMQAGDVKGTMADTSLLDSMLPTRKKTELEAGIRSVVEWYRADGHRFF